MFLRREDAHPNGREDAHPNGSSKLDELADGPHRVVKSEGHTLVLRIGDEDVRVSKNRVMQDSKPLAAVQIAGDTLLLTLWVMLRTHGI